MNVFLVYNGVPSAADTRCQTCRHHKYLVWSSTPEGINALHTQIHTVFGNNFPMILREQGIHWWGPGIITPEPTACLKSYTKIGGTK